MSRNCAIRRGRHSARLTGHIEMPLRRISTLLFAVAVAVGAVTPARAGSADADVDVDVESGRGEVPKWEIGLAGGGGWTPHYPAADQSGGAVVALPYLIYRSRYFRVGEGGLVSGRFVRTERLSVTASISGSLPANSEDNRARRGMPDLDTLFEIGPQAVITVYKEPNRDSVSLKLPLRAVVSTDFSGLDYRGVVFQPRLSYRREHLFGTALAGSVGIGPTFASGLLMDYFYDVPPMYATAERPAYEAGGGYMGSDLTAGLSYRFSDRFRLFVGTQLSYYGGAANDDSPLYRSDTGVKAGVGFVWKAWTSKTTLPD